MFPSCMELKPIIFLELKEKKQSRMLKIYHHGNQSYSKTLKEPIIFHSDWLLLQFVKLKRH